MARSASPWTRSLPWAGIAAVLLLFAADRTAFSSEEFWALLLERVPRMDGARFLAVEQERLRGGRVGDAPVDVLIVGNSRALAGLKTASIREGLRNREVLKLARPGLELFQTRTLAEQSVFLRPEVVVLALSEFDTHRPVRLEPVVSRGAAGSASLADLISMTDLAFWWRNRDSLLRLAAATALDTYRYRELLDHAGLATLRRFPLRTALELRSPTPPTGRARIALWSGAPWDVSDELRARVEQTFPLFGGIIVPVWQVDMLAEVTDGVHVAVQERLLREIVATYRATCADVLIVEAPLHPTSAEMYDRQLRRDFLSLAAGLASDPHIHFLPDERSGPFLPSDFSDLMHLNDSGRRRLDRAVVRELNGVLAARAAAARIGGSCSPR